MRPAGRRQDPTASPQPPAQEVQAPLTFIVPQDTKPYFHSSALTGGEPKTFFRSEQRTVAIHDMRPLADELSLDRHGFELHRYPTALAGGCGEAVGS